jgi:hypothetical protein
MAHRPVRPISPRRPTSHAGLRTLASWSAHPARPPLSSFLTPTERYRRPPCGAVPHRAFAHLGAMAESRVAMPSPLPLLYWPPLPPPLLITSGHQWRPTAASVRPPLHPLAPIKRTPWPCLTPLQLLPPFSPLVRVHNALPTVCLRPPPPLTIARPPHGRPASGERPVRSPVLPSPSPAPWPSA